MLDPRRAAGTTTAHKRVPSTGIRTHSPPHASAGNGHSGHTNHVTPSSSTPSSTVASSTSGSASPAISSQSGEQHHTVAISYAQRGIDSPGTSSSSSSGASTATNRSSTHVIGGKSNSATNNGNNVSSSLSSSGDTLGATSMTNMMHSSPSTGGIDRRSSTDPSIANGGNGNGNGNGNGGVVRPSTARRRKLERDLAEERDTRKRIEQHLMVSENRCEELTRRIFIMERDERRRAQDAVERELDRQKRIWSEEGRRAEAEQLVRTRELEERKTRLAELERKEYEKGIEARVMSVVEDRVRASLAEHINLQNEKIDFLSKEVETRVSEVENGRREIDRYRAERERASFIENKLQDEKKRLLHRLEIGQKAVFCLIRYKKLLRWVVVHKWIRDFQIKKYLRDLHISLATTVIDLNQGPKPSVSGSDLRVWYSETVELPKDIKARVMSADITVLLSYLAEVQHIVKHMVQKMLDQQRVERETSRNFMQRNAMLTEHCMINEETIQAKHRELSKMSDSLRATRSEAEQQRQRHESTVRKLVRLVDDAGHRNHSFGRAHRSSDPSPLVIAAQRATSASSSSSKKHDTSSDIAVANNHSYSSNGGTESRWPGDPDDTALDINNGDPRRFNNNSSNGNNGGHSTLTTSHSASVARGFGSSASNGRTTYVPPVKFVPPRSTFSVRGVDPLAAVIGPLSLPNPTMAALSSEQIAALRRAAALVPPKSAMALQSQPSSSSSQTSHAAQVHVLHSGAPLDGSSSDGATSSRRRVLSGRPTVTANHHMDIMSSPSSSSSSTAPIIVVTPTAPMVPPPSSSLFASSSSTAASATLSPRARLLYPPTSPGTPPSLFSLAASSSGTNLHPTPPSFPAPSSHHSNNGNGNGNGNDDNDHNDSKSLSPVPSSSSARRHVTHLRALANYRVLTHAFPPSILGPTYHAAVASSAATAAAAARAAALPPSQQSHHAAALSSSNGASLLSVSSIPPSSYSGSSSTRSPTAAPTSLASTPTPSLIIDTRYHSSSSSAIIVPLS